MPCGGYLQHTHESSDWPSQSCCRPTDHSPLLKDGDTIKQLGITYRLWGIDAPEIKQSCPDGWPAGLMATTCLFDLTRVRQIVCQEKDRDLYGRVVAVCRVGGEDLGAILGREGFAWAFRSVQPGYVDDEAKAKRDGLGVHRHGCATAWEWRARERADEPR